MKHRDELHLGRTRPAFFSRRETARIIKRIAEVDSLVIYVGAGVTMSESGTSWRSLMEALVESLDDVERNVLDRITQNLPTLQQASIIWNHFQRRYADGALGQLIDSISKAIYRTNQWRSGDYSAAVVLMCDAFARSGRSVSILTTNYDLYLEAAANRVRDWIHKDLVVLTYDTEWAAAPDLEEGDGLPVDDPQAPGVVDDPYVVGVTHLHGIIQQRTEGSSSTYASKPVFAEVDYHRNQPAVVEALEDAFRGRSVLILGSSLEDPPLLQALVATNTQGAQRWALLPRNALPNGLRPFDVERAGSAHDVVKEVRDRSDQFGVQLIVPDFFSQAGQFVREIALARRHADAGSEYRVEPVTDYQFRLDQWWNAWASERLPDESTRKRRQARDHSRLVAALDAVREITGDQDERLKIEMWVRWKPEGNTGRNLQLWASSTGSWPDNRTARRVPIEDGSIYAAVQAFVRGEVLLVPTEDSSDRWSRYLAIPVRIHPDVESQVAGVVCVATADNLDNTKLEESNPAVLELVARYLRTVGVQLLDAKPLKRRAH